MNNRIISVFFLGLLLTGGLSLLITRCKPKTDSGKNGIKPDSLSVRRHSMPPDFNADSAYHFIEQQVAFGPRIPGTAAQTRCANWLAGKLKSYGAVVHLQDLQVQLYNEEMVPCKNIIGSIRPDLTKRVLLFCHWDTRPWSDRDPVSPRKSFDGADDSGSGVGVLLEIARQLQIKQPEIGIDIAFFDVEDYGAPDWDPVPENKEDGYCLGSQEWANTPHVPGYRAFYGICLDMVGAQGATFYQEGVSMEYAPSIVQKVWNAAYQLDFGAYFIGKQVPAIVDDHFYVNRLNATPSIDIINLKPGSRFGFVPHWHTQEDNMNVIDRNTLKAVGQTVLLVVYAESSEAA